MPGPFQEQPKAGVVELVDTRDLKSLEGNLVPVRVRPSALANATSKLKKLLVIRGNTPSSGSTSNLLINEFP